MNPFEVFNELSIPQLLHDNLERMNFVNPTPIQQATIPEALNGRDILGIAQTGTGKTAAFGIPLLAALYQYSKRDALILAPTRELAAQIYGVFKELGRGMNLRGALVVGGESMNRQVDELHRGADYIIATPGRLNDHLKRRTVHLDRIHILVLDEIDRMMDMGFLPQVKMILQHVPKDRQTMLYSATVPPEIEALTKNLLHNPLRIEIASTTKANPQIKEETVRTSPQGKNTSVLKEIEQREGKILIFVRTKTRTERLARFIHHSGHDVATLHGGRTQGQRKKALRDFKEGSHRILVATDLAGRGIDINDIDHVINYDLPATREDYIHRIGRTARYGKTGTAINLVVAGDVDAERVISGEKRPARVVYSSKRMFRKRR